MDTQTQPVLAGRGDDVPVKSYRYLRTAMVGLLVAIAVAVLDQSVRQGALLDSVSAYYYTPARGIFVGTLIGLGTCMIALKGTTPVEDVALNVGGVFATVVAVVPTSRGADYESAVRACRESTYARPSCVGVRTLEAATRANVQNNMTALLVVGLLAIVAGALFVRWDLRRGAPPENPAMTDRAFAGAGLLWLVAAAAVTWALDTFVRVAHYVSATGLFAGILVVAVANARRKRNESGATGMPRNGYAAIAVAMLVVAAAGGALWLLGVITLFWLETAVTVVFAAFWTVQTLEQDPVSRRLRG